MLVIKGILQIWILSLCLFKDDKSLIGNSQEKNLWIMTFLLPRGPFIRNFWDPQGAGIDVSYFSP